MVWLIRWFVWLVLMIHSQSAVFVEVRISFVFLGDLDRTQKRFWGSFFLFDNIWLSFYDSSSAFSSAWQLLTFLFIKRSNGYQRLLEISSTTMTQGSGGRSSEVILRAARNTLSAPMTVADYLRNFPTLLDSRRLDDIHDVYGSLPLFDAGGEEILNIDGDCIMR